jgi:hypothetical protein
VFAQVPQRFYPGINDAIAHLSEGDTLVMDVPSELTRRPSADLEVPATVLLTFQKNSTITVPPGKTLRIHGPIVAGPYQLFSCAVPRLLLGVSHRG